MCLLFVSTGPARRHTWCHSRRFKLLKLPLLLLLLCEQSYPSVHLNGLGSGLLLRAHSAPSTSGYFFIAHASCALPALGVATEEVKGRALPLSG